MKITRGLWKDLYAQGGGEVTSSGCSLKNKLGGEKRIERSIMKDFVSGIRIVSVLT